MFTLLQLVTFVAAAVASTTDANWRLPSNEIGSDHSLNLVATKSEPFSYVIQDDGATYTRPISMSSGGVLEISALDGSQKVQYTGSRSDFYAEYVTGSAAVLAYYPPRRISLDIANTTEVGQASSAFTIDRFASGYANGTRNTIETICGVDNSRPAVCLKTSDSVKYTKAKAVGHLFVSGTSICTGWLFGSEGHLITNNHCIGSAEEARSVQVEFGVECSTCSDPNNSVKHRCRGMIVATSAELISTDWMLDFSLLKLNLKTGVSLAPYGYLQARSTGPVLNEPIYIAQHPDGKPKRIATTVDKGVAGTIEGTPICCPDYVQYSLDTDFGSSGSPVLSTRNNTVVALHSRGGCPNKGITMDKIVSKLRSLGHLPANAVAYLGLDGCAECEMRKRKPWKGLLQVLAYSNHYAKCRGGVNPEKADMVSS
ncbi:hypothetical protein DYB32_003053 [Aphanomyces invadans]|uniref:Serine protease n=1 Tax=Aphanomyces invadans TaxID=157072 RepID=A0A418B1I4_9STRA|nr:hypothetical protein DYB32_003053 [Aphanomyces invadans]